MNVIDKLLTAVEQFVAQENRINTLADKTLQRFAHQETAQAGYCWTETEHVYGGSICHERECCANGGCGPWGGLYSCYSRQVDCVRQCPLFTFYILNGKTAIARGIVILI